MASRSPYARLLHIKHELDWMIDRYAGMDYASFEKSIPDVRAVERGLLIISEAVKTLPPEMLLPYAHVDWRAVRSIGNVLRHEYERVVPSRLWEILLEELPTLREVVIKLLDTTEDPRPSGKSTP